MPQTLVQRRDAFAARHPESKLQVNGRDWGGIRVGDAGPALVLIPGTLGRADIYFQQMADLQGKARILALSYPDRGSIADWSDDIADMIAAQGLQGAVVSGSSLGGYLAQFLAAKHGDLLGGLVAANTLASVVGIDRALPYSLDLLAVPIADLRKGFTDGLATWTSADHPYRELAELLLAEVAGRIPEGELRARLNALKTAPVLDRPSLPPEAISIVESGDDHLIRPPMQMQLRESLPHGRLYRFNWGSHFPYLTRPDDYTALLAEVLGLASAGSHWPTGAQNRLSAL